MSKKQDAGSSDIALSTADGLVKKVLEDVTTGVGGEILAEIPFVSSIFAVGRAVSALKDARYRKNLIAFFYESEENTEFMKRFFEDKANAEIGLEILGLVEQSYLERQAEMIARITRMWKETKEISKETFDEYANIILNFDSHLIRQFEEYINYKKPTASNLDYGLKIDASGTCVNPLLFETNSMFYNPPMDFVSFGFLEREFIPNHFEANGLKRKDYYSITQKAHDFYNSIFKQNPK